MGCYGESRSFFPSVSILSPCRIVQDPGEEKGDTASQGGSDQIRGRTRDARRAGQARSIEAYPGDQVRDRDSNGEPPLIVLVTVTDNFLV